MDVDCVHTETSDDPKQLLLLAKKLKLKYSKEKDLAHLKRINQTGFGTEASCVGDDIPNNLTSTKSYKVGMKQA